MAVSSFDLSGKTALVTGGSRGIGFAIAEALVEHGATVVIAARTAERLTAAAETLSRTGRPARGIVADLEDPAAVERLASEAIAALGRVDILVNNAGMSQGRHSTLEIDNATFERVMAVNFRAAFLLIRGIGAHMISNGGGRIINVTSIYGGRAYPGGAVSGASKGALEMLTKSVAVEWAPHGVLVNAVAPGWIRTDMMEPVYGSPLEAATLARTPAGRMGDPRDIAGMALFLASEAGRFTTGATMIIDGGYTQA